MLGAFAHSTGTAIIIALGGALFYLFAGIGIAAYDFLCPNLHLLSVHTGLSEPVIGATFIAFGNASVDIFSAFVALRGDNAALALGSIVGAAFFIICVVIGAVAIAQPCRVDPQIFLRDVGFLFVAVLLILFVIADGQISLGESAALVLLYVLYALVVIRTNVPTVEPEYSHTAHMHLHPEVDNGPTRPSLFGAVEHFQDRDDEYSIPDVERNISSPVSPALPHSQEEEHRDNRELPVLRLQIPQINNAMGSPEQQSSPAHTIPSAGSNPTELSLLSLAFKRSPALSPVLSSRSSIANSCCRVTTLSQHLFPAFRDWDEKSIIQKITTVIMGPALVALQLSIPIPQSTENDIGPKNLMTVYSLASPIALYVLVLPLTIEWAAVTGVLILALVVLSRFIKVNALVIAFLGFAMAVVWILQLANTVVDAVKYIGAALNISKAFLGLTVVAIGNSLGDLVSNISIARQEHTMMALSACFGSPLLLILIGLGGSSMVVMAVDRKTVISIEQSMSVFVTCILLLLTLLIWSIVLPLCDWKMNRQLGALCIGIWVLNVIINLTIYF